MKFFAILIFAFVSIKMLSQKQSWNWYFQKQAALTFSTGGPIPLSTNVMGISNGMSSSISDTSGQLLFYTDGQNIFNRNHVVMANGNIGSLQSTFGQGMISVQAPGNANLYYLFNTNYNSGTSQDNFVYCLIDMSLASGMGSVTVKNSFIKPNVFWEVAVIQNCNGVDKWVIVHERASNKFMAHALTSTGISTVSVDSYVGPIHGTVANDASLKSSPDGHKLAESFYADGEFDVFDFDPATGLVSNPMVFIPNTGTPHYASGIEFSPDGTKLYGSGHHSGVLYQWDLCAGSEAAIAATCYTVTTMLPILSCLQLGPDGKIYVGRTSQQFLSVINQPNKYGSACSYSYSQLSLTTGTFGYTFPTFESAMFRPKVGAFTYSVTGCTVATFSTPPPFNMACTPTSFIPVGYSWIFGDPASGTNTSTLSQPSHTFTTPGPYKVKLAINYPCHTDTIVQSITFTAAPSASITGASSVCVGQSTTFTASGGTNYLWNNGLTAQVIALTPTNTSIISLTATTGTCTSKQDFTLTTVSPPTLSISGRTVICKGETTTLTANGIGNFLWNTGSTLTSVSIKPNSNTTLTLSLAQTANPCSASKVVSVTVQPCTGVASQENGQVIVAPNPASDKLQVLCRMEGTVLVRITDLLGTVVLEQEKSVQGRTFLIDLDLPSGMYILQISKDNGNVVSKKFVVNR